MSVSSDRSTNKVSRRKGNGPRKRHWCFTSFLDVLPTTFNKTVVRYIVYQRELAEETKREHFQGYIEFFDNKRIGGVKGVLGECHLEPRYGSRTEAREYCRKKKTSVDGSQFEWGLWREDNTRKRKLCDMLKTDMTLKQLIEESPQDYVRYHRGLEKLFARRLEKRARVFRQVEVIVYVGKTGSGKTRKATSGTDWFMMPCSEKLWFDGYEGQSTLIIDDFYGNIKYGLFLRILDGHSLQLPVKGGFIWALWNKVIITSNAYPETWYNRGFTPALKRRVTAIFPM